MRFVALGGRDRAVTLTERPHRLLEAHRRDSDDAREQAFYAASTRSGCRSRTATARQRRPP